MYGDAMDVITYGGYTAVIIEPSACIATYCTAKA